MLISEIIPYDRNARHNERAIPKVAESIKEFRAVLRGGFFYCRLDVIACLSQSPLASNRMRLNPRNGTS